MATGTTTTSDTSNAASNLKHQHGNGQQSSYTDLPANRRSSAFSSRSSRTDSTSDRRPFSARSSTEDLFSPRATGEEEEQHHETTTFWHSLPILFAIVPALGGIYSKDGSVFVTDLALLLLAGLYLNWCLVTPWTWYHSAQSRIVESYVPEDALGEDEDQDQDQDRIPLDPPDPSKDTPPPQQTRPSKRAIRELRYHELFALLLCFLGPLFGSYILHLIRHSLSRASDDLVSSLHLTLFVLCAEIRPLRHAMKMMRSRTLFLQRVIREDPTTTSPSDTHTSIAALTSSLTDLEASFADLAAKQAAAPAPSSITSQIESSESTRRIQSHQTHLQTQIDALTRAVRRYEKRATAQTMQTEARLQDLEGRMRDTLTLAAAAAGNSNRPGIVANVLGGARDLITLPVRTTQAVLAYPLGIVDRALTEVMVLAGLRSKKPVARQSSGSSNGSSARSKGKGLAEGYAR